MRAEIFAVKVECGTWIVAARPAGRAALGLMTVAYWVPSAVNSPCREECQHMVRRLERTGVGHFDASVSWNG